MFFYRAVLGAVLGCLGCCHMQVHASRDHTPDFPWDFHFYDRFPETFVSGHPSKKRAMADLQRRLSVNHTGDVQAYLRAHKVSSVDQLDAAAKAKMRKYVRVLYPPPHYMLAQLMQWARQWSEERSDTGTRLFTAQTARLVHNMLLSCMLGHLSGECGVYSLCTLCLQLVQLESSHPILQPSIWPMI